ncbi:unnamed protein product [Adineta steineri]|nr:unnamed protein product [Adineta steineri]
MHSELKHKQYHHGHRQIWKNIKDLLKSCFGFRSNNNRLFNKDGSLIDKNYLQTNISNQKQSYKQRQQTWPYLLNIYSPTMTNYDKKIYQNQAQIRYNK